MFSEGNLYFSEVIFLKTAIKKVNKLILPANMVKISTNLLLLLKSAVIPLLKPTVLYAETHSNVISVNPFSESNSEIRKTEIRMANIERKIMANALLMEMVEISRLKISSLVFPLAKLIIFRTATAMVLVLIPPPVEPGEAPTHIRKRMTRNVGVLSAPVSTVLNPAVREVTEPKKAVIIFPEKLCPAIVLLCSNK